VEKRRYERRGMLLDNLKRVISCVNRLGKPLRCQARLTALGSKIMSGFGDEDHHSCE
jgi:hypothetical protein